jgi:cytochrome c553
MTMHREQRISIALVGATLAACTNLPRSRDLGNPKISGQVLAEQVCSNCHGVTGTSISPNMPHLAGQQKVYIAAQLRGFRSKSRQDPAGYEYMWGISRNLSDRQIDELADYFSTQTLRPQQVEGLPARIEAGRAIFSGGVPASGVPACFSCHGPEALGNDTYPRLSGQHADYLVKQLAVFQRTDQRPEGAVMKVVAHGLSEAEFADVAAYLQALPALPAAK